MRLTEAVQALAMHLRTSPGRLTAIATRLQDAGLISKTRGSRRYPDDASSDEIVTLFIASIAETGIGTADRAAETFAVLTASDGTRLDRAITDILFGQVPADIAVRLDPPGAALTVEGQMVGFGDPAPDGSSTARFIPSTAIAALRAAINLKESA